MTAIILALAVVALTVYGLERNHRRQPAPGSRLAGSTNTEDRDLTRVTADLRASLERGLRLTVSVLVPAAVAFVVLGRELATVVFARVNISVEQAPDTAERAGAPTG